MSTPTSDSSLALGKDQPLAGVSGGKTSGDAASGRTADAAEKRAAAEAQTAAEAEAAAEGEPSAGDEEGEDSWLSTQLLHTAIACGVSMFAHMAILVMMGLMLVSSIAQSDAPEIVAEVEVAPEEVVTQQLEEEIKPSKELALVSTSISANVGAMGTVSALSQPQQVQTAVATEASTQVSVDVGVVNVFKSSGKQLSDALPEGQLGEAAAIADSYAEAMDRITQEILNRLAKGKVLVIWAMDQSESMNDDREEIRQRIDRVYQELGIAKSAGGDALATAVTSYGKDFAIHTTRPTSNTAEIMAAIEAVPNDPSGFEMQCQAVSRSIQTFRGPAQASGRQMMLVLVTDESGDPASNVQYLEATIAESRAAKCPIYVLGREAVFGYPYAYMTWQDPKKPEWGTYHLQIDRGPETPMPEQLQWDGFRRRNDAHPSGFGPYEQTRMARQTGGVFFMLPSPEVRLLHRSNAKFALEAMRPYLPDLSARSDYIQERDKHEMRAVAWKIISDLNPWNKAISRQLEPRMTFSIDRAEFNRQAQTEMQAARQIITYLEEAEKALEHAKPMRAREQSPRWRANFDMIYGQVLAYQVRLYEYGARLQYYSANPKPIKNILGPKRPTNRWDFGHIQATLTDQVTKAKRDKATEVFQQMLVEHVGTPYATRAEWELRRAFGMDLHENYVNPQRPSGPAPVPPKL